jgi:hypothetical protein
LNNKTIASIGTQTSTDPLSLTGDLQIASTYSGTTSNTADGKAAGQDVAVGAVVVVTVLNETTTALLNRNVTAGGSASIVSTAISVSSSEAKASAKGQKPKKEDGTDNKSADQETDDQLDNNPNVPNPEGGTDYDTPSADDEIDGANEEADKQSGKESGGVGVAAAVAVNWVTIKNTATLADGVSLTAGNGVTISATNETDGTAKGIDREEFHC